MLIPFLYFSTISVSVSVGSKYAIFILSHLYENVNENRTFLSKILKVRQSMQKGTSICGMSLSMLERYDSVRFLLIQPLF